MHDPARGLPRHEGKTVMPRVDTEEAQPRGWIAGSAADQLRRKAHRVAQLETKDVAVEVQRFHVVTGGQHHVTPPLMFGDELVAVGAHDPTMLQRRTVEHL